MSITKVEPLLHISFPQTPFKPSGGVSQTLNPLNPCLFFITLYIMYVERERENEGERGGFIGIEIPRSNPKGLNPQPPTTCGLEPADVEPNPFPTPSVILMALPKYSNCHISVTSAFHYLIQSLPKVEYH